VAGGGVVLTDSVLASNAAAGISAQGGGLFMCEFGTLPLPSPSLVLSNVSVAGNSVVLLPVALQAGKAYRSFADAGNGGGIFLTALQAAQAQLLAGSRVADNAATAGAGVFLAGSVALTVRDSQLARNAASGSGGGLALQSTSARAATAVLQNAAFTGNSAGSGGGAIALNSGSALAAASSTFTANQATNGAVLYLQVANQAADVSPAVVLTDVTATGNVAGVAGGMYFTDATDSTALSSLPACTGTCLLSNTALNGADTLAATPVSFNTTSASSIVTKSGALLPALSLSLYDSLGQLVREAPGLLVSIAANGTGLSGATAVGYADGAALFDLLTISDLQGTAYNLTVSLNSPDLVVLNGDSITLMAVIGPCSATEVFNEPTKTCTCGAGTFLDNGICRLCDAGTYAPTVSSLACLANPQGAYSSADRTTFATCAAGEFLNTTSWSCESCVASFSAAGAVACSACPAGAQPNAAATGCTACEPGTFLTDGGCAPCAAGTFAPSSSSTACELCTPGSFSNAAGTACTACNAGTFLNSSSQTCQACSAGSYSPSAGSVACLVNPPGFSSSTQSTFASTLTLAGVSSASFGAEQTSTLAGSIAATIECSPALVSITSVTAAAAQRHLLQDAASVSFTVRTTADAEAAKLRLALNATAAFSTALASSLRNSGDPVLSAVSDLRASTPAETALVLEAVPCAAGTFLNGATQRCDECDAALVTLVAGMTSCEPCPPTSARASSSECTPCPDNSRRAPNPAQCACNFGYYDTLFGANLTAPDCAVCPLGGVCDSGLVAAAEGFWRETTLSDLFYRCREGNCVPESVIGPLSTPPAASNGTRRLLQLAGAAAPSNASTDGAIVPTNCVEGNTGPLCALCVPGYSVQSGECLPCDAADAWTAWSPGSRAGLLVGCVVAGLIVIAFGFLQPLVPALERAAAAISAGAKAARVKAVSCITCACCRRKQSEPAASDAPKAIDLQSSAAAPAGQPAAAGDASKSQHHHHHSNHAAQDGAVHQAEGNAAFAMGNMAALMSDDGGDEDDGGSDEGVAGHMDFLDVFEETLNKLQRFGKIIIKCAPACVCARAVAPRRKRRRLTASCVRAQLLPNCVHVSPVAGHPMAQCAPVMHHVYRALADSALARTTLGRTGAQTSSAS
jgi:hypothetical protein